MHRRFTPQQVANTQVQLRDAAGNERPIITIDKFFELLSEEILALRAVGKNDEEIAILMSRGADEPISPSDVRQYCDGMTKTSASAVEKS